MNMQRIFNAGAAVVAAVAAMALTAGAASANLVLNGDFSANASSYVTSPGYSPGGGAPGSDPATPADWNIAGTPEAVVGVNGLDVGFTPQEPFAPYSVTGVRDFAFMQDTSLYTNVSINQIISTVAGQMYTLSYVAAKRLNNSSATMETLVLDAARSNAQIASQTPSISTSYFTANSLTFTAASTSTEIEFLNNTNNGSDNTVDVSNVVLNAVPLPASLGLLGFGAVGLGLLMLKRRSASERRVV